MDGTRNRMFPSAPVAVAESDGGAVELKDSASAENSSAGPAAGTPPPRTVTAQPSADATLIQQMLMQQRRKTVVALPPNPSHDDALTLARLSQVVYNTSASNVHLRKDEKGTCTLKDEQVKEIAKLWPTYRNRADVVVPKAPTEDAFRALQHEFHTDSQVNTEIKFEEWATQLGALASEDEVKAFHTHADKLIEDYYWKSVPKGLSEKKLQTHRKKLEEMQDGMRFLASYPDFQFVASSENPMGLQSRVAVSKASKRVFVIFRGTDGELIDLITDSMLCTKPVTPGMSKTEFGSSWACPVCCHPCGLWGATPRAHRGFLTQLMDIEYEDSRYAKQQPTGYDWQSRKRTGKDPSMTALMRHVNREIESLQREILAQEGTTVDDLDDVRLLITGHSLGASLATLFAHEVASQRTDIPINVVTFGSPRTGTRAFHQSFTAMHNVKHLRVQQGCDAVTQLPCSCCFYHHVGEHLWIVPGWIAWAYCLGTPVVKLEGKDHPPTTGSDDSCVPFLPQGEKEGKACDPLLGKRLKASDEYGLPERFTRRCCIFTGREKFNRILTTPSPNPPFLSMLPCGIGCCLGLCCVGTLCINDHSMVGYVESLRVARHLDGQSATHDFWYANMTDRDVKIMDNKTTSLTFSACFWG